MVVVMYPQAKEEQVAEVDSRLTAMGFRAQVIYGAKRTVVAAVGDRRAIESLGLEALPGVEKVVPIMKPFKLASREVSEENTVIKVRGVTIGADQVAVIAGPCAVESREQLMKAAQAARRAGARFLRGGAFKPRTSPYSFQGMEEEGLKLLAEVSEQTGLVTVSEVIDEDSLERATAYIDILQIGTRNMQNFRLLKAAGQSNKPILLKRGLSATIEEWLMAAEYIMSEGNQSVILCERGIRTFETYTRNTLDLSAIPLVKSLSHLPVVVDPSHATGKRELVLPMTLAAVAAGADGLLVEMHPNPAKALCDGPQSLNPEQFLQLMESARPVAQAIGKTL
ncbi:3-deoxy-7-phosphoheptulonate synthase [Desulforamulus ruminis]|uniref:Phospho-2-dehydro-3-deoxyheptonate aldolase n=1 Tax=Desulforamulus ruminis (strain ATCC 23193 / DSM 2154 / NCIMB 8452 / DL) TaxID=696281 RepID=F6DUB9_DESRL|nr:3-deoxy-7-phosphoheptulonate synthase [Desulforamulus ruminis]AEG61304.1 phospho-2-dehydro-3-deoxyheptonate aldolase [Desulforamulus ruminis DSM 2154]